MMTNTRRDVLRAMTAGGIAVTTLGITGTGIAAAQACHKDFSCDEGTYVKYELVERDDGTCYFAEDTDTGIFDGDDGYLKITETKDGDTCEPLAVEWHETGYEATVVMAFGGDECEAVSDPGGSYDATDADHGLENAAGETAAISNLQFCVTEVEEGIYAQIDFARGDVIEDLCNDQYGSDKISSITWGSEEGQIDGVQGQFDGEFVLNETDGTVTVNYDPADYDGNVTLAVYLVSDPVFQDNGHIDFAETRCRQALVDFDTDEAGALDGSLTADLPSP